MTWTQWTLQLYIILSAFGEIDTTPKGTQDIKNLSRQIQMEDKIQIIVKRKKHISILCQIRLVVTIGKIMASSLTMYNSSPQCYAATNLV